MATEITVITIFTKKGKNSKAELYNCLKKSINTTTSLE